MNLNELNPSKILIVNVFGIGDVLFTTPLITALKKKFPQIQIDYVSNKRVEQILLDHEDIHNVFVYERDEYVRIKKESKKKYFQTVTSFIKSIESEQYDVLFDFSMNRMFNVMSLLTGIPTRIGFNYRNRSPFLTFALDLKGFERKHVVQHYLDLLAQCGISSAYEPMKASVTSENQDWVKGYLTKKGICLDEPILGIFPGGGSSWGESAELKRWSKDKYIKLIHKIVENSSVQIILMGDQSEEELCFEIVEQCSEIHKSFGELDLGQLLALIQNCQGIICNDGGPLHMAVAVGIRTVSIFGPVDPVVYGPWQNTSEHQVAFSNIMCQPCYKRFRMTDCEHISCMKELTVNDVYTKAKDLL